MSLISCTTSRLGCPVIADLNLRGRLASSGSPMKRLVISSISGVGSMISSAAMPASGLPSTTRGVSPQASVVCRPTASRRRQISGTSSTRIQWYWMFCRSLMSAVPRAKSWLRSARTRSWRQGQRPAVEPHPEHEVLVGELGVVELGGAAAVDARLALGVQAPPAEPTAEVLRRDGGETLLAVDLLDPRTDVEAAVLLLPHLVGVERLAPVDGPLTVGAPGPRRAQGPSGRGLGRLSGHRVPHGRSDVGLSNV